MRRCGSTRSWPRRRARSVCGKANRAPRRRSRRRSPTANRRLANVWLPGFIAKLQRDNIFEILETEYPESPMPRRPAERSFRRRWRNSARASRYDPGLGRQRDRGGYLPDYPARPLAGAVRRAARRAFPAAKIELVTEAWGGRNTGSYLAEPPGSPHNYREKVLGAKPDLVVSEFVNDAGLTPEQVEERYGKLLADFRAIGAEWIILTPHYVRPDWMGLTREREIDDDPRPYVHGLAAVCRRSTGGPGRRLAPLRPAVAAGDSLQHADAQLDQPPRRPRHEAVRRQPDGIVSRSPAAERRKQLRLQALRRVLRVFGKPGQRGDPSWHGLLTPVVARSPDRVTRHDRRSPVFGSRGDLRSGISAGSETPPNMGHLGGVRETLAEHG